MNGSEQRTGDPDPEEEIIGPERYLQPGEELLIWTPDIQIKKFRFEAYLTDRRLFLVDQRGFIWINAGIPSLDGPLSQKYAAGCGRYEREGSL